MRFNTWRFLPGFAAVMALAAAGCGGESDNEQPATSTESAAKTPTPEPTPTPDPRPRVEGKWRMQYTPRDAERDPERTTWTITPRCPAGACDARVVSSSGAMFKLDFDEALGDYMWSDSVRSDCTNNATGEVIFKDAYKIRVAATVTPAVSVKTPRARSRPRCSAKGVNASSSSPRPQERVTR